jgi:hypothetical protein
MNIEMNKVKEPIIIRLMENGKWNILKSSPPKTKNEPSQYVKFDI